MEYREMDVEYRPVGLSDVSLPLGDQLLQYFHGATTVWNREYLPEVGNDRNLRGRPPKVAFFLCALENSHAIAGMARFEKLLDRVIPRLLPDNLIS